MHRRTFLQKAVYAAPTLLALGGLSKPTQAEAGFGGPPSDPNGFTSSQTGSQSADCEGGDVVSTTLKSSSGDNDIVAQTLDSEL